MLPHGGLPRQVSSKVLRSIQAEFVTGEALYRAVVLDKLAHARESVWISTANVKAMFVEQHGKFDSVVSLFRTLAGRGVELRLLHAEVPSRPFRKVFDRLPTLVRGGLELKICPRVHFKCVVVDGAWAYLGSANLTGAGLGAKHVDSRNFELGLLTEDFDVIDRLRALFTAVWTGAECGSCRVRSVCPDPIGQASPRPRRGAGGQLRLGRARRLPRNSRA